jgi:hypothetical protein
MAEQGVREIIKRKRASKPKVTTGCITCKYGSPHKSDLHLLTHNWHRARHVKCDEERPHCHRCKSTGRKCDWVRRVISTSIGLITDPVYTPIKQFPGSLEERNYFQFFCTKTTLQLSGLFGSTFWSREVLQASVLEPAIWHAAVAVSSLQQERSATICKIAEGDEPLSDFTLGQYVKAMQYLRGFYTKGRKPAAEVVLLCCILFICFEVSCGSLTYPLLEANTDG